MCVRHYSQVNVGSLFYRYEISMWHGQISKYRYLNGSSSGSESCQRSRLITTRGIEILF
jgi:hypothetical protein